MSPREPSCLFLAWITLDPTPTRVLPRRHRLATARTLRIRPIHADPPHPSARGAVYSLGPCRLTSKSRSFNRTRRPVSCEARGCDRQRSLGHVSTPPCGSSVWVVPSNSAANLVLPPSRRGSSACAGRKARETLTPPVPADRPRVRDRHVRFGPVAANPSVRSSPQGLPVPGASPFRDLRSRQGKPAAGPPAAARQRPGLRRWRHALTALGQTMDSTSSRAHSMADKVDEPCAAGVAASWEPARSRG